MLLSDSLAPIGDFYVKKLLEKSSPQAETNAVRQAARQAVPELHMLTDFRFVSSSRPLIVRTDAGSKSAQVGFLSFGRIEYWTSAQIAIRRLTDRKSPAAGRKDRHLILLLRHQGSSEQSGVGLETDAMQPWQLCILLASWT